jgi:hypothetical protein
MRIDSLVFCKRQQDHATLADDYLLIMISRAAAAAASL